MQYFYQSFVVNDKLQILTNTDLTRGNRHKNSLWIFSMQLYDHVSPTKA